MYVLALAWTTQLCLWAEVEPAFARLEEADLIITDCDMPPGGGGLALLRHLRQSGLGTPVLMVTGDPTRPELSREFPGQPVLGKPFTVTELEEALAGIGFPELVRQEPPAPVRDPSPEQGQPPHR